VYAVIKAGGHQYRVAPGDELTVDFHQGKEGDKLTFDNVLMIGGDKTVVGSPLVKGAKVEAVIKQQTRDPKILVFKYKRRKNYKRTKGHKQPVTVVEVKGIKQ
tara:strand:- start:522 stop:830 length:309 start_codon:yes stop_codon:yes gene_type:complete